MTYDMKFIPKNVLSSTWWIEMYKALIAWRQKNVIGETLNKCEHHHIIPRCWQRENNNDTVKLTLGEHVLAHFYLMNFAYHKFGLQSSAFMRAYQAFNGIYGRSPFKKCKMNDMKKFFKYEATVRKRYMEVDE